MKTVEQRLDALELENATIRIAIEATRLENERLAKELEQVKLRLTNKDDKSLFGLLGI